MRRNFWERIALWFFVHGWALPDIIRDLARGLQ